MTAPGDDWARWSDDWRGGAPGVPPDATPAERVARERRRLARTAAGELAVALVAIVLILIALLHTPTGGDITWGLAVLVLLVVTVWWARRDLRRESLAEPTESFVAIARRRCRAQLRAVRVAWVLLALEAAFFVPWWAAGLRYHLHELGSLLAIRTLWLPLVGMIALAAWTLRAHAALRRELAQLDRVDAALRETA